MARDVEFNVTASDKTGTALAGAEAKFKATQDRITRESDKASSSLTKMGAAGAQAVSKMRRELQVAENDLKGLALAYANAGSAAERLDITKQIRKQKSEISGLKGAIKSIEGDVVEAATTSGRALGMTVGATAAPFLAATLSAAIIGAAGIGGVIGGALLAARDPRVKSAGTELTKNLLGQLERDAAPFVDPLLKTIATVEIRFGQMNTRIKSIFSTSSGFLDPLVDGLLDGVDGILRGIDALVSKAQPVIEGIGKTFDRVGNATGDAFEIISGGSEEAADALDDLSRTIEFIVVSSAYAIRALTELYGAITFIPRKIGEAERSLLGWDEETKAAATSTSVLATVQKTMGTIILSAGEAAGVAGLQMQTYADKMSEAESKGRSLYDSQTSVGGAIAGVKELLEGSSRSLSANSEKGRENRTALSNLAGALNANYQAYVKVNGEGRGAQAVAEANRKKFIELATSFTGSKKKAEELATQMGLIPAKKRTDFTANTHDAEGRIKALQDRVNSVHGKTVNVTVAINAGRLANIENRLARLGGSLYNAAGATWAALDSNSGTARSGGPTPVSLTNELTVSLDGTPFYAMTARAGRARSARDAWRQKVGRR